MVKSEDFLLTSAPSAFHTPDRPGLCSQGYFGGVGGEGGGEGKISDMFGIYLGCELVRPNQPRLN
jgi:hypothetical protein